MLISRPEVSWSFKYASTSQVLFTLLSSFRMLQIPPCPKAFFCSWASCARSCSDSALLAQTQGPDPLPFSTPLQSLFNQKMAGVLEALALVMASFTQSFERLAGCIFGRAQNQ